MSIEWESILPDKFPVPLKSRLMDIEHEKYNEAIDRCHENLKSAESRGEICKPLSVEEIEAILFEDDPQGARTPHGQAEAIHRAMTKGDVK